MIVYFAMLTLVCALALWSIFLPAPLHRVRYFISMAGYGGMCLFIGMRDHVGADWNSYIIIFRNIQSASLPAFLLQAEPLYAVCNRLVQLVGGDIHLVNLVCAAILLGSLFHFSRLVELDSNLLLFVCTPYLLFVVGMGYTRQSVAVGLGLSAIGYLRHDRTRMFYLFAGMAALFHYSAIFLVLLWWMNTRKRLLVAAIGAGLASPLLVLMLFSPRYVHYLDNDPFMQSNGVWSRILLVLLALSLVFVQRARWSVEPQLRKAIARGAVALSVIILISLFLTTLADRLCLYLSFIYVLGVGSLVRYATRPFRYISIGFVVCLTYAIFIAWFGLSAYAASAWFPYGNAL